MPQADEKEGEAEKSGLFCFLNGERACGSDCMAYTAPPAGADYEGKQWANCKMLVALHQGGKHITFIAQTMSSSAADKKREQPPPPPPR